MMDWDNTYSVGNQRIDFQHRIFLDLLNEFEQANQDKTSKDHQIRTMRELIKYAEYHFMSEENLMIDFSYPDLERHRILHNYLLSTARTKAHELELGMIQAQEVLLFLRDWFLLHTLHDDKALASYISKKTS